VRSAHYVEIYPFELYCRQPFAPLAVFSLIGLTLASLSAVLAISSTIYAHAIGGFRYYDPLLLTIYRWGGLISLAGILTALIGVWRPGLRWGALICSLGTFLFWFFAAMSE
jgi:hypothetical protein